MLRFSLLLVLLLADFSIVNYVSGNSKEKGTKILITDDGGSQGDKQAPSHLSLYKELLRLTLEQLRTQKIHVDEIKERCDWLQRNGIELKKLPQIVFHASKFLDEEAIKIENKIGADLENEEKTDPFGPSLIAQMKRFLEEIKNFIDQQKTLTTDEVENMTREVSIAGEELGVASKSIGEKKMKLGDFLRPGVAYFHDRR